MAPDQTSQVDVPNLLDTLFEEVTLPDPTKPEPNLRLYPEIILQKSEKGNKLYASFQRYSPQFIKEVEETDKKQVLRWRNSNIESVQQIILDSWIAQNSGMSSVSDRDNFKLTKSVLTTGRANKLFVWSSSDSYIQEKKRQLQLRKSTEGKPSSQSHKPSAPAEDKPVETDAKFSTLQSELHLRLSTEKVNNKLSKSIEIEANKFIHARIQKIRDHHSEQMTKQINERKRKDHEIYLQRLKLKEEEYEKSIRQDQDQDQVGTKKLNFFETLFGLGGSTVPPNTDDENVTPANSTTSKNTPKSSKSKRTTLFGMQSLFSSSNGSKKRVDKTTMFDAEDKSDSQSIVDFNLDHSATFASEEPEEQRNSPSMSDSWRPKSPRNQEMNIPLFNVDELESLELKRSPQKSGNSKPSGSRANGHSIGTNEEDGSDDEFTEFTAATSDCYLTSSPPPLTLASAPKLSHNFFSVEKANANATPATSGNELIDLFDTKELRPSSLEINSPTPSQLHSNMDNLLDL